MGGGNPDLTGKYFHGVDAKGRLTVPSQLRKELGDVSYVIRGPKEFLNVYTAEGWARFCAKFEGKSQTEAGDDMRALFANAATCEVDGQGRILVPSELREYAGIVKNVTIVGLPDRAELWDTDRYKETENSYFQKKSMADIYKELGL